MPEHQQHVAIEHRVIAGREPDQPGHADVVGVLPLDMLLAAHRVHHRRLEPLAERQKLIMRACASGAAQYRHTPVAIEHRRQPVEIRRRRRHHRLRAAAGPPTLAGGASDAGCSATSPGITTTDTPRLPTASRIATSSARGIWLAPETSSQ